MPSIIHLSTVWEHTLIEIINHDNKTQLGIIMRAWVEHNKLEDMTGLLIYDLNDFTPTGPLCNYKETAEAEETQNYAQYTSERASQPLQIHPTSHSQIQI